MVGTKGKGKTSPAKLKRQAPPAVAEESSEGPSNGEENKMEILSIEEDENDCNKGVPSTDEKENDDTTSGLVVGNEFEENQPLADEENDDEKGVANELNTNKVEEPDDVVANDEDSEMDGVDTEEENTEELSDSGGVENDVDVEDSEGKPDEVAVENKEPISDPTEEEIEDTEVAEEGKMVVTGEGLGSECRAKKPKRKIIKKVVKIVRKKANSAETGEHEKNRVEAETKPPGTVNKKRNRKRKSVVSESNGQGTELRKENDKVELEGNKKAKKSRRKAAALKKKGKQNVSNGNVVTGDTDKPGESKEGDTKGMIFMCSSQTKKDCYQYNVMGLPAGKKEMVMKIYKGMKLFLFDVESRMLYGIYKAAAPGGFNIEPEAFKSKFPSQVRFTVHKECLPLAEEKLKGVIGYYTKNKFNSNLTNVQVGKLCKLFHETTRKADSTQTVRNPVEVTLLSAQRDGKGKRKRTGEGQKTGPTPSSKRDSGKKHAGIVRNPVEVTPLSAQQEGKWKRKRTGEGRKVGPAPSTKRDSGNKHAAKWDSRKKHAEKEARRGPGVAADRYYQHHPVVSGFTPSYLPPPTPQGQMVYQGLPPPVSHHPSSYSYGGPTRDDLYQRGQVLGHHELGLSSLRRPYEANRHELDLPPERVPVMGLSSLKLPSEADRRESYPPLERVPVMGLSSSRLPSEAYRPELDPPLERVLVVGLSSSRLPSEAYRREPDPPLERVPIMGLSRPRLPSEADRRELDPPLERVPVTGLSSLRLPSDANRYEPYGYYRENRATYLEPVYEIGLRRDVYEPSLRRDLYEPSVRREHYEYTSDARRVEYYSASAEYRAPLPDSAGAEYHAPLPAYRRY